MQSSRARDINGRGQVVGRAATEERVFGFLWSFWDGLLDLLTTDQTAGAAVVRLSQCL